MPVWGWILIAVAVVLVGVAVGAAAAGSRRKRTERLKDRFGPEYERTVSLTGEPKAAEKEDGGVAERLRHPLARGADRIRRPSRERGRRGRHPGHRGDA
jgi:hypothetical protein